MALARGLISDGNMILFDEPIESFDAEGISTVHAILSHMAQQKRTIIVMSHDPNIVKGQHTVLDINSKPTPKINVVPGATETNATEEVGKQPEGE